ncbi:DUF4192 family protein [Rathayibacter sp. VKM Ac-2630]|uniref:DUF4192 family protein n=1 Tax=Rathayibacter sp. VKM Ac-2630 TaxID=1938617 RepID=UPI0009CF04C8|nr:DUF4192 family protein [Rathayibacter sp. VKM Ac-2630]OOB90352.1 hypothetical protein B0T42_12195 [Rathayibacter sp. VKM Ac-2630]
MTPLDTASPLGHTALLSRIPQLVGFHPRESVVLVPVRDGAPTGALRFDLPGGDPALSARAFLGALGRFGRADSVVAVLYADDPERSGAVAAALRARARQTSLPAFEAIGGTRAPAPIDDLGTGPLGEARKAVAEHVDLLLDRHPRAELPGTDRARVDALLRRAADGREIRPGPELTAAVIVSAQRPGWIGHALAILLAPQQHPDPDHVISAIARVAELAPRTERARVLVLLAAVHWSSGGSGAALRCAREAGRTDPHEEGARRLVAALECGERSPWRFVHERAA